MNVSGVEDDDFASKRSQSPVCSFSLVKEDDDSNPTTPKNESVCLKNSLGLVLTPQSPPYRRVHSLKLEETPKSVRKIRLEPPSFSSTPLQSPSLSKIPRSLKVQKHCSKSNLIKEKLNLTADNIPSSLVNPFSPNQSSEERSNLKNSRAEKKRVETKNVDENGNHDDLCQKGIKRPRLSDFNYPKFEKEYIVLSLLGSGVYGCVFKCLHLLTGMEYAVKRSLRPVNNEKVARNEIFAHAALEHPYIVRNYTSWTENDYLFMQNEYCNGGSLEDHLNKNGPLEEKELMVLLEHIAQGLRFIHMCNLAHMDLKPGNIFLTKGPQLFHKHHNQCHSSEEDGSKEEIAYKIGDLGHVIKVDNSGYVEDGDCRYLPREMLNDSHPDYFKVDIFALGLTLYEAAGGGPLPKNGDEWQRIRDGHIKPFPHISTQLNELISMMLNEDPKKRPSTCEILDEICRDEALKERELKAANQKIQLLEHQLSDIVKTVSNSVNVKSLGTAYKKRTINNNIIHSRINTGSTPDRCTRSTTRLVGKRTPKSLSSY